MGFLSEKIIKDRAFFLAIILSFVWHIFWLSVVNIVVAPSRAEPIKFSKVSFLGPILERGGLEVRLAPKVRSFLEKRYLNNIEESSGRQVWRIEISRDKYYIPKEDIDILNKDKITNFIDEAVSGQKLEPIYNLD